MMARNTEDLQLLERIAKRDQMALRLLYGQYQVRVFRFVMRLMRNEAIAEEFGDSLRRVEKDELQRGVTLAGPHRDDLVLLLGDHPAKGYASHGESWSMVLALRLASFELLRIDGDDPVLILDDVFAELDSTRRERLAQMVVGAEQVLVTAAVADDIPHTLSGDRFTVDAGLITADQSEGRGSA